MASAKPGNRGAPLTIQRAAELRARLDASGPLGFALPAALSTAVFTFVVFKVAGFHVLPANLVLGMLLVMHPMGVLIARRLAWNDVRRVFAVHLVLLGLSVLGLFLLPRFAPGLPAFLAATRGGALPLVAHLAVTGAVFVPFFLGTGMVEYAILGAYATHREGSFRGYALLLACVLAGTLGSYALVGRVGLTGLGVLVVALALIALVRRLALQRALGVAGAIATVLVALEPSLDVRLSRALQPEWQRTSEAEGTTVLSRWGKYAYVEIVDAGDRLFARLNGYPFWDVAKQPSAENTEQHRFDVLVAGLVPEGGRLAVIGSGGGKQVQSVRRLGRPLEVDAYELEPSVIRFLTVERPELNDRAYLARGVRAIVGEGRTELRRSGRRYHAVYLADPGNFFTYYKTLLDPTFFLHTRQAYADYAAQLEPGGVVAALVMRDIDVGVSQRIVNVLDANGFATVGYTNRHFNLILGTRANGRTELLARTGALADSLGLAPGGAPAPDPSVENAVPTDDRGGSYLYALLPSRVLRQILIGALALLVLSVGLIAVLASRRRARARELSLRLSQAIFLGVGFVLLQNMAVLEIATLTLDISDAAILGSAVFLVPAAVGARFGARLLGSRRSLVATIVVTAAVGLMLELSGAPRAWVLPVQGVLFVISGALFPGLLAVLRSEEIGLAFACDSLGAALGTLVIFVTPLLFGIRSVIVLTLCMAALVGAWLVFSLSPAGAEEAAT